MKNVFNQKKKIKMNKVIFVKIVKIHFRELLEYHKKGILMVQLHFINQLQISRKYTNKIHHRIGRQIK